MQTVAQRLASFQVEQQLAKRRTSSQRKKVQHTATWPHQTPTPEDVRLPFYSSIGLMLTVHLSSRAQVSSTIRHPAILTMLRVSNAMPNLMDGNLQTMPLRSILHILRIAPGLSVSQWEKVKNTIRLQNAWSRHAQRHMETYGHMKERRTGNVRSRNW